MLTCTEIADSRCVYNAALSPTRTTAFTTAKMTSTTLSEEAIEEIASHLPASDGKTVVELNAGGANLLSLASRLTKSNNVISVQVQVGKHVSLQPEIDKSSVDLVISANSALQALLSEQINSALSQILECLKPGGELLLVERCFQPRKPVEYAVLIEQVFVHDSGFEVESASTLKAAVKQGDFDTIWWRLKKVTKTEEAPKSELKKSADQKFLDNVQYSVKGILKYERIFGIDYVSTGGEQTTRDFCATLRSLKSAKEEKEAIRVLDVGCGTGGSAFYMKNNYGTFTLGIDLSLHMISIAWEKQHAKRCDGAQFLVADATKIDFDEASFDLIYSRDAILHIHDKLALFRRFHKWLKPGGELFITDYCATDAHDWSEEFSKYVEQRGYHLVSPNKYGELLREAGFVDVEAKNNTEQFVSILRRELEQFTAEKQSFLQDFTQQDYDSIANGWNDKIRRCEQSDEQQWGTFHAYKS